MKAQRRRQQQLTAFAYWKAPAFGAGDRGFESLMHENCVLKKHLVVQSGRIGKRTVFSVVGSIPTRMKDADSNHIADFRRSNRWGLPLVAV